jgi:hypothetical protein
MGRIVFVFNNSKTGENNHYYHKLLRHYEDGMIPVELHDKLSVVLCVSSFIFTNEHRMILKDDIKLYGNKVFCILRHDLFYEMLEKNLIYIGCNGIVDYDSDDLQSEICADIPDLTANLDSEDEA